MEVTLKVYTQEVPSSFHGHKKKKRKTLKV